MSEHEELRRIAEWNEPVAARLIALINARTRKGGDPAEWPEDLRVREWPR
ncbi:MAG: hypothetical protein GF393_10790 [Armatimonadia bacterium]|nr:hypothetical protein [Armatimonadia bacterium]